MRHSEFLQRFVSDLREGLPQPYRQFETRYMGGLVKVHFGQVAVHYEVALHANGYMELGLHFEASRETNERLLRHVSERALDIVGQLGPHIDIEQWTKSWGRVHQTVPYTVPDERLLALAVERMAAMIVVLQPILEET